MAAKLPLCHCNIIYFWQAISNIFSMTSNSLANIFIHKSPNVFLKDGSRHKICELKGMEFYYRWNDIILQR